MKLLHEVAMRGGLVAFQLNRDDELCLARRPILGYDILMSGAAGGLARVSAEDVPEPEGAGQPRCIRCNGTMMLVRTEPKEVFDYRYELRTFHCDQCGFAQTYTMGRS